MQPNQVSNRLQPPVHALAPPYAKYHDLSIYNQLLFDIANQIGQLLVMGPQTMPSYYKNPKATSEIMDTQGFVKTGEPFGISFLPFHFFHLISTVNITLFWR